MTETLARPTQVLPITTLASVDITIPVLNEERAIASTLSALSSFLETECAYDWAITVADNGSTDATSEVATSFAAENPRTRVIRLDQRGRGRALKEAWSTSRADVVAYMDVDLSTGLESLQPLIDPILDGRCELSIGSRLLPGAEIARSVKRELISRTYNAIARNALRYNVADAQCGFKAVRASVFRELLSSIVDNEWFFDTELLALAHRNGLRINEVPVRWVDDDDSRVKIAKTASEDLKGIWRVRRTAPRAARSEPDADRPVLSVFPVEKQEFQAEFDQYAKQYENSVDQSVSFTGRDSAFFARRKVEILEDIVRPGLGSLQGLSLLDVGCGTGTTDRYLAPRVRSLHGVDISEEMLAKAEQNVPKGSYSHYDGTNLPFDGGTFDVVVAICVLHHVPVPMRRDLVRDMVRVVRPGGVVAVFEHNPFNPLTRHAVNTCELDEDAVLLPSRESAELLQMAADVEPGCRYYLFSPLGGAVGCSVDRHFRKVPLGGQYVTWATRSDEGLGSATEGQ
jgi:ubiquinone/menaquinone biosynthesis C-methylase UbiE